MNENRARIFKAIAEQLTALQRQSDELRAERLAALINLAKMEALYLASK